MLTRRVPHSVLVLVAACRVNIEDVPTDASDGEPLVCPASYTITLPSTASRYRVSDAAVNVFDAHRDCADDEPGATHLVNIQTLAEGAELGPHMDAQPMQPAQGRFYVGAVQRLGQTNVAANWIYLDGQDVFATMWRSSEPDDLDDLEDGREQFTVISDERLLIDVGGYSDYGMICECDGIPIAPETAAVLPP